MKPLYITSLDEAVDKLKDLHWGDHVPQVSSPVLESMAQHIHKFKEEIVALKTQQDIPLRDHFAAKAFAAIIGTLNGPVTGEEKPGDFTYYADCAYRMADAMIAARHAE